MAQLRNWWWSILLVPLAIFLSLMALGVDPDMISLWVRLYLFVALILVAARYVWRAPFLMWTGDLTPESRNVAGWGVLLVSTILTQGYAWVYIWMERPSWLANTYFAPGFTALACVGATLVASSVQRKIPPSGSSGLPVASSFILGFIVSSAIFLGQHMWPLIVKAAVGICVALSHAV